jgi:hypothetical protein
MYNYYIIPSERFRRPVMREFYKEKDVVMEERRMRTESQPIGKLIEESMHAAFKAHPYGEPPGPRGRGRGAFLRSSVRPAWANL